MSINVPNSNFVKTTASNIKLATFNLFNYLEPPYAYYDFNNIYSESQWQKKQAWIRSFLHRSQVDVVAFQEVFSSDSLAALTAESGYPYYAVVDSMDIEDDFICSKPVVAIASKYPITQVVKVEPDLQQVKQLGLADEFTFSRSILRATVELPMIGLSDCYVVHFKSQRPAFEHSFDDKLSTLENDLKKLQSEIAGSWGSSIQRGSEALLLQMKMMQRRHKSQLPMMLFGDFNMRLYDGVLQHLITDDLRFPNDASAEFNVKSYLLADAWQLYINATEHPLTRPATHYFKNVGSVLDYILLSNEFDALNPNSLFSVSEYQTDDMHLINPRFETDDLSTDHAIPVITIIPRQ